MGANKPALEQIKPGFGSSILIRQFTTRSDSEKRAWHVHPEMELIYVNGGSGKRHIGSHISYYTDGDLMFIGSNLPHFGFTDRFSANKQETMVHLKPDFLGETFMELPEMAPLRELFSRAAMGLTFHGETKEKIGEQLEALVDCPPFERLVNLLGILKSLAQSKEYTILNLEGFVYEVSAQDNNRFDIIFDYVRNNFTRSITLDEISDKVSMTVPAFCRYFKHVSGKTFTKFVNEHRLVHASKLLSEKPTSITDICYESGFNNFSHFNRLFKEFTGKSPSQYRNEVKILFK